MNKTVKILFVISTILISLANILASIFFNLGDPDLVFKIVNSAILFIISIILSIIILKIDKLNLKHAFLSSLFLIFITINFLDATSMLNFPTNKVVPNFYKQNLDDVLKFSKENNVKLNIIYEYSDNVKEYTVISQKIDPGTSLKKVKDISVIVSDGPDPEKVMTVPNMLGWDTEKVLKFINESFLSNVNVIFTKSEEKQNTVISQSKNGDVKRNEKLELTFSQGTEDLLVPVEIIDFTNKSLFESTLWLAKNGFTLKTDYVFNDDYKDKLNLLDEKGNKLDILKFKKGNVLEQNIKKGTTITPGKDEIILKISKGKKIVLPDILGMSIEEITSFVVNNKLKIKYLDNYDDTVPLGKIISANHKNGDILEEGTLLIITSSKGQLKMEEFSSVEEFKTWASKYNITIAEEKENSDTIEAGNIIRFSHAVNQTIKNGETVTIYISKGPKVAVPNLRNKTRNQIQNECSLAGITARFTYAKGFSNIQKDLSISQSIAAGTMVDRGTSITITLSPGPGINVPNFSGMSKGAIQTNCNNIGLRVNFIQGGYSSVAEGNSISQSIAAGKTVANGTTITITLSKGPARSKTVSIQNNWLVAGNAIASGNNIKAGLEAELPGANVQIKFVSTNGNNIGLPASSNVVTLTQGQTTVVSIYK